MKVCNEIRKLLLRVQINTVYLYEKQVTENQLTIRSLPLMRSKSPTRSLQSREWTLCPSLSCIYVIQNRLAYMRHIKYTRAWAAKSKHSHFTIKCYKIHTYTTSQNKRLFLSAISLCTLHDFTSTVWIFNNFWLIRRYHLKKCGPRGPNFITRWLCHVVKVRKC